MADLLARPPSAVRQLVARAFARALELDVDLTALARLLATPAVAPPAALAGAQER